MRRAKIICTLGPASCEPAMLEKLIDAGMALYPDSSTLAALRTLALQRIAKKAEARANPSKIICISYI